MRSAQYVHAYGRGLADCRGRSRVAPRWDIQDVIHVKSDGDELDVGMDHRNKRKKIGDKW